MRNKSKSDGSALLITILVVFVLSLVVASALKMVTNEYRFTMFSSVWSQALQTAEAGVELAMDAYNDDIDNRTGWPGWIHDGSDSYTISYASLVPAGHGGLPSDYTITVNTNTMIVTSKGRLNEPASTNTLKRTVEVVLEPDYFQKWEYGLLGNTIFFNGNPQCDSYNSALGAYGGANVNDDCDIGAITEALSGIVGVGGPVVNGDVYVTETGSAEGGFWTGDVYNDFDVEIPTYIPERTDITDPAISGGDTIVVAGTKYMGVPSMTGSGGTKTVTFRGEGKITVYVDGLFEFKTSHTLTISPDPGKNLTVILILNGADNQIAGTLNTTTDPINLQIYGTENCLNFECVANNDRYLTIYAPQAEVDMGGTAQVFGSVVGSYVEMSGTFDFHYDESLATNAEPMLVSVSVKSWKEI